MGSLWSLFSLPSTMTVASTFPPSAAFFNESNQYSPLDLDEKKNPGECRLFARLLFYNFAPASFVKSVGQIKTIADLSGG